MRQLKAKSGTVAITSHDALEVILQKVDKALADHGLEVVLLPGNSDDKTLFRIEEREEDARPEAVEAIRAGLAPRPAESPVRR